jgi:hypothetical protein
MFNNPAILSGLISALDSSTVYGVPFDPEHAQSEINIMVELEFQKNPLACSLSYWIDIRECLWQHFLDSHVDAQRAARTLPNPPEVIQL